MRIRTQAPHEAVSPRISPQAPLDPFSLGEKVPVGADEGAFPSWKKWPLTSSAEDLRRAIGHLQVVGNVHAAVSHGLTSSPPRGEGTWSTSKLAPRREAISQPSA